ncbi:MAG: bifunctional nuclease family protein [Calditrichaeota bacterium]|nr:bifunctional nuclease family protein [Calditrichota bacterium]
MVEVRVNGIFMTQTQASGIILKEQAGKRALPIVIGEYEAQSIALALENLKPPRPITHDLTANILETLGISMEQVIITELKDNTYYAIIKLNLAGQEFEIDSRPSDAIALAIRLGTPIFVDDLVMEQASYIPEEESPEEPKKNYLYRSKEDELEVLREQLKKAVEAEEYEKAAKIRDKIKRLESGS